MNEAIREMFLTEWVETASKSEIVEKLIEHDERAKQNKQLKQRVEQLELILKEIREYLDEFIIYVDGDGEVYFKEEFKTEYNDLLQIIDKGVKNE